MELARIRTIVCEDPSILDGYVGVYELTPSF